MTYHDLPTAEWLAFFAELGALKVMNVILAGGEPFKRPDLPALLEGIVRHRMRFALLSNRALIEDGTAAFIATTRRCDYVQVSVDGASPAAHDAGRGRGSFKGALRGIRILQQHGVPVTVHVTIHRHNVHDLENIARLLLEELGLPGFSTNAAGYLGSCQQHADELLLTTAERQEAMTALLRLAARYPGRIQASAGPLAEGRTWARMEAARRDHAPPFAHGGRLTGCGCPRSEISGSHFFAAYAGPSMNPTLVEPELIEIEPYYERPVRVGDVVFFTPPGEQALIVHRVVRLTAAGIRTRGDHNARDDAELLEPADIQAKSWRRGGDNSGG